MNAERQIYTVQFHPEVRNSEYGLDMLKNFVFNICKAENNWSMKDFIEEQITEIRRRVGDDKVLLGLSGGVDSSVVAALLNKAIGKNLYCMFIDHGLMRKGEAESVLDTFSRNMDLNLIGIDASERFLTRLKGVSDPEEKRKKKQSRFYSELSMDNRFASLEGNKWDLRNRRKFDEVYIDTSNIEIEDEETDEPIDDSGLDIPKGEDAY